MSRTQCETILRLLRERGQDGVTPTLALEVAGCFRLAARISDLKAAGHDIVTETHVTPSGARVARYVIREQQPTALALPW